MAEPGLLLIRGLGHSGTTILDLALGAHPQVIGLGEAVRVLDRPGVHEAHQGPQQLRGQLRFERHCTCGAVAAECPVWGPILPWLPRNDDCSMTEKVSKLIQPLASESLRWVVESYQSDEQLIEAGDLGRPLRVIHLTRDVRSWVHSVSRRRVFRQGKRVGVGWRSLLRWWRVNHCLDQRLKCSGHPVFQLGYEELALAPELALKQLCRWLELDFDAAMLRPGMHSTSHILAGNRMRFEPGRSDAICYDGAWMASSALSLRMAPLLPPVARLNRRLVYANGLLGSTWPAG